MKVLLISLIFTLRAFFVVIGLWHFIGFYSFIQAPNLFEGINQNGTYIVKELAIIGLCLYGFIWLGNKYKKIKEVRASVTSNNNQHYDLPNHSTRAGAIKSHQPVNSDIRQTQCQLITLNIITALRAAPLTQLYYIAFALSPNVLKKGSTRKLDGAVQQERLGGKITTNLLCASLTPTTEVISLERLTASYPGTGLKSRQIIMTQLPHKDDMPNPSIKRDALKRAPYVQRQAISMGAFIKFLTARTGLEWGLYILSPFLLSFGLFTGRVFLPSLHSGVLASFSESPALFWGIMVFHGVCVVGLVISVRARLRNKSRWFPEQ